MRKIVFLRKKSATGKQIKKFFRSLILPYSSEDEGIKMLAFTVYSNDLKNTLMKKFYQENSEMKDEVEIETEHKMSGKFGGTLKVRISYFSDRHISRKIIDM